jgi:hypothetical protein
MIPWHLLPKVVQHDLAMQAKIRLVVFLAAVYLSFLALTYIVIHYADAIDQWSLQ